MRSRKFTAEDQERVSAAWTEIFADISALGADPDPGSEQALAIARRADALLAEFSGGDPKLLQAASKMNREAFHDPELSSRMPGPASHFVFVNKAIAQLRERGETVACGASEAN